MRSTAGTSVPSQRRGFSRRRGSMLFEVLLALAILTLGMATVGIQVNSAWELETEAAEHFRKASLIESMLAQVEALIIEAQTGAQEEGEISMPDRELELEGEFGLVFPGYAYRVRVEPLEEIEDLNQMTIELLQAPFDPDTGDLLEEPQRVYLVRTQRASPVRINLEEMGVTMTPDQHDLLAESGLLDEDGNLNLQALLGMEPAALLELLPMLMAAFGGGQMSQMMGGMSPEQLLEMLQEQQRTPTGDQTGEPKGRDGTPNQNQNQEQDLFNNPPSFDQVNPGGGLTPEQFDWMLEQLRNKQRGGR